MLAIIENLRNFWQHRNIRENKPGYLEPIRDYEFHSDEDSRNNWVPCGWSGWVSQPQPETLQSDNEIAFSPRETQAKIKKNQELAGCFRCKYFNQSAYTSRAIISGCAVHPLGLSSNSCSDYEIMDANLA